MLSQKWSELFQAFEQTRQQAHTLQQRQDRNFGNPLLFCLLAASAMGFLALLVRHLQ